MATDLRKCNIPVLSKYRSWAEFIRDTTLTNHDLISALDHPSYIKGLARAVSKHPSCDATVFHAMRCHWAWFVRVVGYFHYNVPASDRQLYATQIVQDNKEHGALIEQARYILEEIRKSV